MLVTVILSFCLFANVNGRRIAGGNSTEIQNYPFAAALLTNNGQGTTYTHGCGGTILTSNAILSAASCFYTTTNPPPASWWRARVGSNYSNRGGTIHIINRITPHPDFLPLSLTLGNDIAVVRTTLPIVLIPGSVEVARISGSAYTFGINQEVRAIGWGATSNQDPSSSDELREVQIWTIDQTTCSNRWNTLGFSVTSNMVCVGWLDVGVRGQCAGDVGSPLLDTPEGLVVGVFSRGILCADDWFPDVNTRVAPYVNWIISAAYQT